MPFICKCPKIYNDKTFKFKYIYIYNVYIYDFVKAGF